MPLMLRTAGPDTLPKVLLGELHGEGRRGEDDREQGRGQGQGGSGVRQPISRVGVLRVNDRHCGVQNF